MRKVFIIIISVFVIALIYLSPAFKSQEPSGLSVEPRTVSVIPQPHHLQMTEGTFRINRNTKIYLDTPSDEMLRIAGFLNEKLMTAAGFGLEISDVMPETDAIFFMDAGLPSESYGMHVEPGRDFVPFMTADVRTVVAGDKCPHCGAEFYSKKGNELGHIFKLGYKYSRSMNVSYLDENGKQQVPVMGCYGIGVDRALASIIEEHHDKDGIVWPMSAAPYQVVVVPVKYEGAMKETADTVYEALCRNGIEVLLDDRNERPGVKFKDMDLIGIPVRIVVGEKTLPNVEIKIRAESDVQLVPAGDAADVAAGIVRTALSVLNQ